jgi:hypothetical protein
MFETLIDDNFSVYLMRDTDADVSGSEIENLVSKFRDIPVNFATIDLGYMTLREFNETKLAKLLKDFEIPYFTIELPHYVKGHFTSQISEIKSNMKN